MFLKKEQDKIPEKLSGDRKSTQKRIQSNDDPRSQKIKEA